ncbi:MAG: type IV pilus modification protein PilV [Massilia sp.]
MRVRMAGGFTLIEVLVAVFVLALGIVGACATHAVSLRTRHESSLMSSAVHLGATLADSMRANPAQMRIPDGRNPYLQLRYDSALDGPPAPPPPCHHAASCDSAAMAEFDIGQLRQAVHASFPGGRVLVCRDQRVWDASRHALGWDCAGGADAPIVIKLGWRGRQPDGATALDGSGAFAPSVAIVMAGGPG